MSALQQLGPAVFNIGSEIQQKMVTNLLSEKYGYNAKKVEELWEKTRYDFVHGRSGSVYKYNKLYDKKKGDPAVFYLKKLNDEYKKSGITKSKAWPEEKGGTPPWNKKYYGTFQTIINCFLYDTKNNDYYKWALDNNKFQSFAQSIDEMFTDIPGGLEKRKSDIAKNNKKFEIEARAGLIEASLNITKQCFDSCGDKPKGKFENVKCYICGEVIDDTSGEAASGSQCEHVVPVTSLAALCGLSGPDYEKTIDAYFVKHSDDRTIDGTIDFGKVKITRTAYKEWRRILLGDKRENNREAEALNNGGGEKDSGVMYRWAHPGCNMIKKDHAFLGLDWTAARDDEEWYRMKEVGFPLLDENDYCDKEGIKYVLNCLANEPINGKKGGGGSNSSKWRARFENNLEGSVNPLGKKWVEERYEVMKNKSMRWAMCAILNLDIDEKEKKRFNPGRRFKDEKGVAIEKDQWPAFRTTLCELSMKILDFRVEEKIKVHYNKFVDKKGVSNEDLHAIIEEWRKAEWIDLIGEDLSADSSADSSEVAVDQGGGSAILSPVSQSYFNSGKRSGPGHNTNTPKKPRVEGSRSLGAPRRARISGDPRRERPKEGAPRYPRAPRMTEAGKRLMEVAEEVATDNQGAKKQRTADPKLPPQKYKTFDKHNEAVKSDTEKRGLELLKILNDKKLILQIYFDVYDTITDVDKRICRTQSRAEDYRENLISYISSETLRNDINIYLSGLTFSLARAGRRRLAEDDWEGPVSINFDPDLSLPSPEPLSPDSSLEGKRGKKNKYSRKKNKYSRKKTKKRKRKKGRNTTRKYKKTR
jgi:hypothetical protein